MSAEMSTAICENWEPDATLRHGGRCLELGYTISPGVCAHCLLSAGKITADRHDEMIKAKPRNPTKQTGSGCSGCRGL